MSYVLVLLKVLSSFNCTPIAGPIYDNERVPSPERYSLKCSDEVSADITVRKTSINITILSPKKPLSIKEIEEKLKLQFPKVKKIELFKNEPFYTITITL